MHALIAEVISQHAAHSTMSKASEAIGDLLLRASGGWKSILHIVRGCADKNELDLCANDCAAILRCMHDCALQGEYIYAGDSADGKSPDDLGLLYLEFEHIERFKRSTTAVKFSSQLAQKISQSPLRAQGEMRNQAAYDRVKGNYTDRNGRVRNQWYTGDAASLARKINRQEEYFWFTSTLHSSIHGGPLSVRYGPATSGPTDLILTAQWIIRRLLIPVIKLDNLILSEQSTEMMNATAGDLLNPT